MWQDIKNVYHLLVAILANVWFGFPFRKLTVIGVTGTDGKTTTVHLIHHILKTAGYRTSMVSSLGAVIGGRKYDIGFHVTTPSPFALQRLLKSAARSHYSVLEVTSHAIDQHRIWGIPFTVGVLTNVTLEHLDYHNTYEEYVRTKTKLLEQAEAAVVNRDDRSYKLINAKFKVLPLRQAGQSLKLVTYGLRKNADVNPQNFPLKTKLIGKFNKYNVLAAIAACRALGINDRDIRQGIETFKLPVGRTEVVYKNKFTVMVDFAHTPNALRNLLETVRGGGRLIHVFGAAGERDRQKRSEMGEVSAKYADVIILTAEDPRSESVDEIIKQIESGIKNYALRKVRRISDRQEAINEAIRIVSRGDVIVITGKGHERSMNYGRGEEPWSEHEAVKKALSFRSAEVGHRKFL